MMIPRARMQYVHLTPFIFHHGNTAFLERATIVVLLALCLQNKLVVQLGTAREKANGQHLEKV